MKRVNPWQVTGYKAGQTVACKVVQAEPGGYAVLIPKDNLPGFLPTEAKLRIGEEILAQYVCVHNNRILLSSRTLGNQNAAPAKPQTKQQSPDWQQLAASGAHSYDPIQSGAYGPGYGGQSGQYNAADTQQQQQGAQSGAYGAQSGSYQAQGQLSEPDLAFKVYAENKPFNFRLRRAIDLILPPLDKNQQPNKMNIGQSDDLLWLITDLEGGMRTGCVKAFCEGRKSRSAVLLYRGRAVGCIYGTKGMTDPLPTESSLQMMLSDCQTPNTQLVMYGLPEEVTLAMSALFLGYPVERTDDLDARSYMDYIMNWFAQKQQTACLAYSVYEASGTLLAFVHRGAFVGAFYVESQEFSRDINFVYNMIAQDKSARVEASILPPELTSASVRLGFSLSMNMPKM